MDVVLPDLIDRVSAGLLRYEEPGRVHEMAPVDAEFAADRSFEAQANAERVRPDRALINELDVIGRYLLLLKDITGLSEHIAAVVERHETNILRNTDACFEVDGRKGVS